MCPERSVMMSLISDLLSCLCWCDWFPAHAASAQALDFFRVKSELLENFVVVFSQLRRSLCRYFCDAVHLNRTTDCKFQVFSRAFERDDYVVSLQLRIIDYVLRVAHQTVGDVRLVQDFAPVRNRL